MKTWLALLFLAGITNAEWKEKLSTEQYQVLREKKTERAYSGRYLFHTEPGVYKCAACKTPLFFSESKYEAGSGWPCFSYPISAKAVYYLKDASPFKRYEVLCRGCDSHLGHVFRDGPPPKELRYCINSLSLLFEERSE